jgi:hypothetical protein
MSQIPPNFPPFGGQPPDGQPPGMRAPGSGPAPALLIGLVVLAAALAIGLTVVLTREDDSETTITSTTTTSPTTAQEEDTTTTSEATSDDASESAIVDEMAAGIRASSGGAMTDEEAECVAEEFLDMFGVDRMVEIGQNAGGGNPFASLTSDEQTAVATVMVQCVDAETLAEIGSSPANPGA